VNGGAFVATRRQISLSRETAFRRGQPPAFSVNEARLGARVVHPAIVRSPPEETLCQLRALIEALGDEARGCSAKVDDWKFRRLDQTVEVTQTFGLQTVNEEELGHALVGGLMGGTHVENALEAPPGTRKIFRKPRVFGLVHPLGAVIRELPARLLRALPRFTPLCLRAPLRLTAHDRRLYLPSS
jgi:hypothetical protein